MNVLVFDLEQRCTIYVEERVVFNTLGSCLTKKHSSHEERSRAVVCCKMPVVNMQLERMLDDKRAKENQLNLSLTWWKAFYRAGF